MSTTTNRTPSTSDGEGTISTNHRLRRVVRSLPRHLNGTQKYNHPCVQLPCESAHGCAPYLSKVHDPNELMGAILTQRFMADLVCACVRSPVGH